MKRFFTVMVGLGLSATAFAHGDEPGAEDVALTCAPLSVNKVKVRIDRTEATLTATLPNGNLAEGRYVKTQNISAGETLYVLNTGGTLVAGMTFLGRWFSTVDQIVVRERQNACYNLAFNFAAYAACDVVPEK